jgi:hypothetical protein
VCLIYVDIVLKKKTSCPAADLFSAGYLRLVLNKEDVPQQRGEYYIRMPHMPYNHPDTT